MPKEDLTGKKIGLQTVLEKAPSVNKRMMYKCICECGTERTVRASSLRNGESNSCGCVNRNNFSNHQKDKHGEQEINLLGQRFGKLLVVGKTFNEKGQQVQKCLCDCGNERLCYSSELLGNRVKSCGQNKCGYKRVDLVNQTFGLLTVIERTEEQNLGNKEYLQKCKCQCGGITKVSTHNLINGHTISCGCIKSKGEMIIAKILSENNIPFEKEYTIEDCIFPKTSKLARFDFYVNNQYIIEFDGIQHFEYRQDGGQNNEQNFLETKERDAYKDEYCIKNNIPLIRIPYTKINDIVLSDLMIETTNFLVKGD